MISQKTKWLEAVSWNDVVEQNRKLSEASHVPYELHPEASAYVRKLWETVAARPITLFEALDTLRQCIRKNPFRYHNVSTFSAIGARLLESRIRQMNPVEACILTTSVSKYVANQIGKGELRQLVHHFDRAMNQPTPDRKPETESIPQTPSVQAEPQTT